ncbi:MAG: DNA-binding transcriptional regulator [Verrucomicrobiales bacterium]|nr:DNA-binding transcriptional regulator [Verrucomicrobiales bacterium]
MSTPSRRRVALLVETSLGSGREILRGIGRYARHAGNWQLFHAAGGLADAIPHWMKDWKGDAVIARIQNAETLEQLSKLDIPVIDVLGVCENQFPLVHVDDIAIGHLVGRYFVQRNYQHFGFYGIAGENWSERRCSAFREECGEVKTFHELSIPRRPKGEAPERFQQVQEWVRQLPKPAAIMVCSDQRGLELLEACLSEDIAVPEEIAVVGVDNDAALCEISDPPLSSVRGGHFNVGLEAARNIDLLLSGEKMPAKSVHIPPNELIERESSATHAILDPIIARGVSFIRQNLASPITNDLIARHCGISRTLFQKRFRETMGQSIREFILERRVERALVLIRTSNITLADVAERSGFKHQEYLGQIIKKSTGETPGQIRRSSLEPSPA